MSAPRTLPQLPTGEILIVPKPHGRLAGRTWAVIYRRQDFERVCWGWSTPYRLAWCKNRPHARTIAAMLRAMGRRARFAQIDPTPTEFVLAPRSPLCALRIKK